MLVSYHITHPYPHGAGRSPHTPHKKKRSPTHKIGEWRIIIIFHPFISLHGGLFFFFFLLAYWLVYLFESLLS